MRFSPLVVLYLGFVASPSLALKQDRSGLRRQISVEQKDQQDDDGRPIVVDVYFQDKTVSDRLYNTIDVWKINHDDGILTAAIPKEELDWLETQEGVLGVEKDEELSETVRNLGRRLQGQTGGIPGYPCYRTVEETYATAEAIVANNPTLANWTDIGNSWDKDNGNGGYDIYVLKLTNQDIPGPKPAFFGTFAIHAREYTTAEVGTRFAEMLVDGYGVDPQITWLLDYQEVHLVLQANPDGRKKAETGLSWRKNVNENECGPTSNSRGVDLNRNFDFEWGNWAGGSSDNECDSTYRGPSAASEPELQAIQAYARSIFPDQRGPALTDPAPADAEGVAIDVHASGELVLWPWGFTSTNCPNNDAFVTLGRKLAFFNGYRPLKTKDFTTVDGDSLDFFYGDLGVAGLAYELGSTFFEPCSNFVESEPLLGGNLDSLLFAAQVARAPYLLPAGPEATSVSLSPSTGVLAGATVLLIATVDDTRYNNENGAEATQSVASAAAYVDVPPWEAGAVPIPMVAVDSSFNSPVEGCDVTLNTTGLSPGRHIVFVQGTDAHNNEGLVGSVFLDILTPCSTSTDCDDGVYCNGAEECISGACQPGTDPCPGSSSICDEQADTCDTAAPTGSPTSAPSPACIPGGEGLPCTSSTNCCAGVGLCSGGNPANRVCQDAPAVCGNSVVESGEDCDGSVSETCVDLGFSSGTLTCSGSCAYDTSNCSGGGGGCSSATCSYTSKSPCNDDPCCKWTGNPNTGSCGFS